MGSAPAPSARHFTRGFQRSEVQILQRPAGGHLPGFLSAPIIARDRVVGVINVQHRHASHAHWRPNWNCCTRWRTGWLSSGALAHAEDAESRMANHVELVLSSLQWRCAPGWRGWSSRVSVPRKARWRAHRKLIGKSGISTTATVFRGALPTWSSPRLSGASRSASLPARGARMTTDWSGDARRRQDLDRGPH